MPNHAVAELLWAVRRFRDMVDAWHLDAPVLAGAPSGVSSKALELHSMNFRLWHLEDAARLPGVDDHGLARLKRGIDDLNGRRNACTEALDAMLLDRLGPFDGRALLHHTETPGTIVDRLSILALRLVHARDAQRPADHLAVLDEQYRDLAAGLDGYLARLCAGQAAFKLYRQFKSDGQRDPCATSTPAGYRMSANWS
ncbi:DUF4254 domain-containing protein [Mycolicibacterium sp. S2-37]|uniref:DUF4254 domain-containing protein n=1 Tax=Mycolicibacterium sp. S2-37 TaxID=2810297 RepID=UPI001A93C000|nr:DUF4254 domain-containing protein [Mycolicibacterium sp. S2-37]MBO0677353.1 DUF4254 domain-containing protein [Mycolicibacterium sp. S2-37]